MSDHFKFDIHVVVNDRWHMEFDGRGDELKHMCHTAVEKVLEEKGFRKYRDEYWVG